MRLCTNLGWRCLDLAGETFSIFGCVKIRVLQVAGLHLWNRHFPLVCIIEALTLVDLKNISSL